LHSVETCRAKSIAVPAIREIVFSKISSMNPIKDQEKIDSSFYLFYQQTFANSSSGIDIERALRLMKETKSHLPLSTLGGSLFLNQL